MEAVAEVTREQYAHALATAVRLTKLHPEVGTPERDELDAAVDAVMAYEAEHYCASDA